jgi:ABC-type sugar transport system substrate-binding protein
MMKKVCLRLLVAIVLMAALVPAVSAAADGRGANVPNPYSWEFD